MENINTAANTETLIGSSDRRDQIQLTSADTATRDPRGVFKSLLTGQSGGGEGHSERRGERESDVTNNEIGLE